MSQVEKVVFMPLVAPRRTALALAPRAPLPGLPRAQRRPLLMAPRAMAQGREAPRPTLPVPGSVAMRRTLREAGEASARAAVLPCVAALQPWIALPSWTGPLAGVVAGLAVLVGLARLAHRQQAPLAYESRGFFLGVAEGLAEREDWAGALDVLQHALDPALQGPVMPVPDAFAAEALREAIARGRWELGLRVLQCARLSRPAALQVCEQLAALGHPPELPARSVLLAMDTQHPRHDDAPALLVPLCEVMATHAPSAWLRARAASGWFPALYTEARRAGRVGPEDGLWLFALYQYETARPWYHESSCDHGPRSVAAHALAPGGEPMLRTARALWAALVAEQEGARQALRGWAETPALRRAELAEPIAAMLRGTLTEDALSEAFAVAGSSAPHVDTASMQRALQAWRAGDREAAMARVARLATSGGALRAQHSATLARTPGELRPMLRWCLDHAVWTPFGVLLHALRRDEISGVLDLLTAARAERALPPLPLWAALFGPRLVDVSSLTPAQQETVVALSQRDHLVTTRWWDVDDALSAAFDAIFEHARGAQVPALLAALRASRRIPQFAQALGNMLRFERAALAALAEDPTLPPRGLLLAAQALAAGGPALLQRPGCQQLLRSRHILKDETRFRRALAGFADFTSTAPTVRVEALQALVDWPRPAALRALLTEAATGGWSRYMADVEALHRGAAPRAQVRAARDEAGQAVTLLALHARHVYEQGNAAEVGAHFEALASVERALAEHWQLGAWLEAADPEAARLLAALTDGSPVALRQAHKGLGERLHALKAARAPLVTLECVDLARAWVGAAKQLRLQREALLVPPAASTTGAPHTASGPADFFARPEQRRPLGALHHRLLAQQLDALGWMGDLYAMHEALNFVEPQDLFDRLVRKVGLAPAQLPPFKALLHSFRQPRLLWALARRVAILPQGRAIFDGLLAARLQGEAAYRALRATSPQMRALFGQPGRASLLEAWEAGVTVPGTGALQGMALCDTDDFVDLVSSADEVSGSCHALLTGAYAPLLIARLMDGSKRMLAVKDAAGALKARAMLRLMHTEDGAPALLVSVLYVANLNDQAAGPALVDLALQRARALGLPLYGAADMVPGGAPASVSLLSHSATIPEYWDELRDAPGGLVRLDAVKRLT